MSVIFAMLYLSSIEMTIEIFLGVFIVGKDVEAVAVDFHITADCHITWSDPSIVVINVLVPVAVKEFSLNDARVLLSWLIDRDAIVSQVEGDDKAAINILRYFGVETSGESEDLFVVVNTLEEVALWFLWNELVDVT